MISSEGAFSVLSPTAQPSVLSPTAQPSGLSATARSPVLLPTDRVSYYRPRKAYQHKNVYTCHRDAKPLLANTWSYWYKGLKRYAYVRVFGNHVASIHYWSDEDRRKDGRLATGSFELTEGEDGYIYDGVYESSRWLRVLSPISVVWVCDGEVIVWTAIDPDPSSRRTTANHFGTYRSPPILDAALTRPADTLLSEREETKMQKRVEFTLPGKGDVHLYNTGSEIKTEKATQTAFVGADLDVLDCIEDVCEKPIETFRFQNYAKDTGKGR